MSTSDRGDKVRRRVPCAACGAPAAGRCSGCKIVGYCSQPCYSKHRSSHKLNCKRVLSSNDKADIASSDYDVCRMRKTSEFNSSVVVSHPKKRSVVPSHGICKDLKEPRKILFPYEEFVKLFNWDKPGLPPCGLINSGNSCFVNVILQCLASTRPLLAFLLQRDHSRRCIKKQDGWCFFCELEAHMEHARESLLPFAPTNILSLLPNIGGNLDYQRQEDAHEFMRFAIDTMQSVCIDEFGVEKSPEPNSHTTTIVQYIFGGHLQSQVTCNMCNVVSNHYDNILDLTVAIQGDAESLEDCLDHFVLKECLEGKNMYKCDSCNDYAKATKQLTIHQAPNVLTIALKRFQSGSSGILNKRILFPENLDLTPYMSGKGDDTNLYTLYGVIVHVNILNTSTCGHYICYTKDCYGSWYKFDDSKIMNVKVEEVLSQGAYMLFYSRRAARREAFMKPLKSAKRNPLAEMDPNACIDRRSRAWSSSNA